MNIHRGIFRILAVVTIVLAVPLLVQINYAAPAKPYEWDAVETLIQLGSYMAFIWIACLGWHLDHRRFPGVGPKSGREVAPL
jgi:hypothetical protein